MAFVNVAEWSPHSVVSWLQGLEDSILPYVPFFFDNNINGCRLLLLSCDDLENLNVIKIGHQEIILDAVDLLKHLHYNFCTEALQTLALKLGCKTRSLFNQLKAEAGENAGIHLEGSKNNNNTINNSGGGSISSSSNNNKSKERVSTKTLSRVCDIMSSVKAFIAWIDRYPIDGQATFAQLRKTILKLSVELASTAQRDQFVEFPNEVIKKNCAIFAEICDRIVQDLNDSLAIQPAWLDVVSIKKKKDEELGLHILSSYSGIHIVGGIKPRSAADCQRIDEGDEIVQINYQTVVGWRMEKLVNEMKSFRESSQDGKKCEIVLTLKKRPRHNPIPGQITRLQPYKLPSVKYQAKSQSKGGPRSPLHSASSDTSSIVSSSSVFTNKSIPTNMTSMSNDNRDDSDTENEQNQVPPDSKPCTVKQGPVYICLPRRPRPSNVRRRATISGSSPTSTSPSIRIEDIVDRKNFVTRQTSQDISDSFSQTGKPSRSELGGHRPSLPNTSPSHLLTSCRSSSTSSPPSDTIRPNPTLRSSSTSQVPYYSKPTCLVLNQLSKPDCISSSSSSSSPSNQAKWNEREKEKEKEKSCSSKSIGNQTETVGMKEDGKNDGKNSSDKVGQSHQQSTQDLSSNTSDRCESISSSNSEMSSTSFEKKKPNPMVSRSPLTSVSSDTSSGVSTCSVSTTSRSALTNLSRVNKNGRDDDSDTEDEQKQSPQESIKCPVRQEPIYQNIPRRPRVTNVRRRATVNISSPILASSPAPRPETNVDRKDFVSQKSFESNESSTPPEKPIRSDASSSHSPSPTDTSPSKHRSNFFPDPIKPNPMLRSNSLSQVPYKKSTCHVLSQISKADSSKFSPSQVKHNEATTNQNEISSSTKYVEDGLLDEQNNSKNEKTDKIRLSAELLESYHQSTQDLSSNTSDRCESISSSNSEISSTSLEKKKSKPLMLRIPLTSVSSDTSSGISASSVSGSRSALTNITAMIDNRENDSDTESEHNQSSLDFKPCTVKKEPVYICLPRRPRVTNIRRRATVNISSPTSTFPSFRIEDIVDHKDGVTRKNLPNIHGSLTRPVKPSRSEMTGRRAPSVDSTIATSPSHLSSCPSFSSSDPIKPNPTLRSSPASQVPYHKPSCFVLSQLPKSDCNNSPANQTKWSETYAQNERSSISKSTGYQTELDDEKNRLRDGKKDGCDALNIILDSQHHSSQELASNNIGNNYKSISSSGSEISSTSQEMIKKSKPMVPRKSIKVQQLIGEKEIRKQDRDQLKEMEKEMTEKIGEEIRAAPLVCLIPSIAYTKQFS
ncbi:uncharacterized protein LOC141855362 isoform X2 [Brevipalpus obovatus]|uniref:uncharacterized protein LOC141855362 isoform X2 n=1 Tax=Brevipalpus obovatus TaxID=246614 RepID=UPI003D9E2F18